MAANKFATMLHNKTNKITLILVYALLEWILIILLLLNSLFSYLIIKFADYFGLKRPCLWCSRIDHVIDPENRKNLYKELVCESHAHEISKLGYCSNHRKLVESQHMCEDCSSSSQQSKHGLFRKITFMIREEDGDDDEKRTKMGTNSEFNAKCSCCDVSLEMESKYDYSSYLLIKPNWEVLDYTQKANLITEAGITDDEIRDGAVSEQSRSDFAADHREDGQRILENPDVNEMLLGVVDGGFGRREGEDEGDSSATASGSDGKEDDDGSVFS